MNLAKSKRGELRRKEETAVRNDNIRRLNVVRYELKKTEQGMGIAKNNPSLLSDLRADREDVLKKEKEIQGDLLSNKDRRGALSELEEDEENLKKFEGKTLTERVIDSKAHMIMRDHNVDEHSAKIAAAIGVVSGIDANIALKMAKSALGKVRFGELNESAAAKKSDEMRDDIFKNGKNSKYFVR